MKPYRVFAESYRYGNQWVVLDIETGRVMTSGSLHYCVHRAREIYRKETA